MQIILDNFPFLSDTQIKQFSQLGPLYTEWNQKINVISRKDIDHLYERHVLHSLAIAKIILFEPQSNILDLGTGGGFPGIPLAIFFPETNFTLVDGTGKKIKVVNEVIEQLGLTNVVAKQARAEEMKSQDFDFVVTRAVAKLEQLIRWCQKLYSKDHRHIMPNGLIALKGGDLKAELKELPKGEYAEIFTLTDFYEDDFFKEKFGVYVQA